MSETGLCLVWIPEADVIAQLLGALGKEERDVVLVRNSDRILTSVELEPMPQPRRAMHLPT
jgi:hypothetical protein